MRCGNGKNFADELKKEIEKDKAPIQLIGYLFEAIYRIFQSQCPDRESCQVSWFKFGVTVTAVIELEAEVAFFKADFTAQTTFILFTKKAKPFLKSKFLKNTK